jgi:hypothetical protein
MPMFAFKECNIYPDYVQLSVEIVNPQVAANPCRGDVFLETYRLDMG